jgi:hypothetical protein
MVNDVSAGSKPSIGISLPSARANPNKGRGETISLLVISTTSPHVLEESLSASTSVNSITDRRAAKCGSSRERAES